VYTAFDYRFSQYTSGVGVEVARFEAFGVVTRVYALERPGGRFEFRLHDELHYPDVVACADWGRLIRMLSQGVSIQRLTSPGVILKAVPRSLLRNADKGEVAVELGNVFLRWSQGFGVLEPILAGDIFSDVIVSSPGPDGGVRVFVRGVGFGDSYHPLHLEPNQCPSQTVGQGFLARLFGHSEPVEAPGFNEYLLDRASERTRTPVTSYSPAASATLSQLRLRVEMAAGPVGNFIAFRKHPLQAWTLARLIASNGVTPALAAKLLAAVTGDPDYVVDGGRKAVLVIGQMGSGKTTLTAALANTLPPGVRVVFIQDVDEYLPLPTVNADTLNTREATGLGVREVGKAELIRHAVRSGAHFMTVNEVLDPEDARAWILAVTSGHSGFTTIHAGGWDDLVERLGNMGVVNPEGILRRSIIVVLMAGRRATRVWWPRGLKWCPNQEPCAEDWPFEARPYPEALANGLIKASLNPDDYVAVEEAWLGYRAGTPKPSGNSPKGLDNSGNRQWGVNSL
jgi:type IV secretory pathway ATPase VirB11/archaellum biosynthesis ATPase